MIKILSDEERKGIARCQRTMSCAGCAKLSKEFGKWVVDEAIKRIGPTASAGRVRIRILLKKIEPEFGSYNVDTTIMQLGEEASVAAIRRYVRTLNPENS